MQALAGIKMQKNCYKIENYKKYRKKKYKPLFNFNVLDAVLSLNKPRWAIYKLIISADQPAGKVLTLFTVDLLCGECRSRSACTYLQSDLALHSPQFCY